jgi:catechol 2,3-dioxygenase-like lactoylglutathione lyase family enzyme
VVGENAPCLLNSLVGQSGRPLVTWCSQSPGFSCDKLFHGNFLYVQNKDDIMTGFAQPKLHTIGIVVKDMPRSIGFYRLLGLDIPEGDEQSPHVEYESSDGYSIGFDTEAAVMETGEHWRHPSGSARVNLQFQLETPHQVDEAFARVIDAGAGVYARHHGMRSGVNGSPA